MAFCLLVRRVAISFLAPSSLGWRQLLFYSCLSLLVHLALKILKAISSAVGHFTVTQLHISMLGRRSKYWVSCASLVTDIVAQPRTQTFYESYRAGAWCVSYP